MNHAPIVARALLRGKWGR
jgi:hypothetical protein